MNHIMFRTIYLTTAQGCGLSFLTYWMTHIECKRNERNLMVKEKNIESREKDEMEVGL